MTTFFRKNVSILAGYVAGEQPKQNGIIKLNTNENPYPPSPRVLQAVKKAVNLSLRLYPDPFSDSLRSVAAEVYGVRPENILAGNGSDEILSILLRSFVGPNDRVAFPVPTYSLYNTLVAIQDAHSVELDYAHDFALPDALFAQDAALTFVCNPNSPSGTLTPLPEIERLARSVSGVLVIDEAYVDFAESEAASVLPLVQRFPNLVVLRSFSKSFSLAGMRIGLAFASEELISGMMKVKDSYNLNRLSIIAATAALQDLAWMSRNVRRVQKSRQQLASGLSKLGYMVHPSHANFVMAQKPGENLRAVYESLRRKKILVRYFDLPRLQDCLRITVGTREEVKTLLRELEVIETSKAQQAKSIEQEREGES
jgi:histidinol-phosphate aminotransferase